jgi:hypothetical protein
LFLRAAGIFLPALEFAAEQVDRPEWNVGDSWSYARTANPTARSTSVGKSNYSMTVTEKTAESYFTSNSGTDADGKPQSGRLRWSIDTNFMNRGGENGQWQEYRWYKWPLAEGAGWTAPWKFPTTDESPCQAKVHGWESIVVPAGAFKALHIEFSCGYFYHGVDGGSGRTTDDVWYSPLVKRHVRMARKNYKGPYVGTDDIEELVSYRVQ